MFWVIFSFFWLLLFIVAINAGSTLLIWCGILFQLFFFPVFLAPLLGRKKSPIFEGLIQMRSYPRKRGVRLFRMYEMLLITLLPSLCDSHPSTWLHSYGFVSFFCNQFLDWCKYTSATVGISGSKRRHWNAERLKTSGFCRRKNAKCLLVHMQALKSAVPLFFLSFFLSFSSLPLTFNEIHPEQSSRCSAVCLLNRWRLLAGCWLAARHSYKCAVNPHRVSVSGESLFPWNKMMSLLHKHHVMPFFSFCFLSDVLVLFSGV